MIGPRFRVGDKVRVIDNNSRPDLVIGSLRAVVAVSGDCVELDGAPEPYTWTAMARLEPVGREVKAEVSIKPGTQLDKVRNAALAVPSITLQHLSDVTGASEAAASARLRDLRKFGYTVSCIKPLKGCNVRHYIVVVAAQAA